MQRDQPLQELLDDLEVAPSKYQEAIARYDAVSEWLNAEGSELQRFNPSIYAQGSFALGTVVKPLGDDDYDVDSVCLLRVDGSSITQKELKQAVGARLKEHKTYERMLDPAQGGNRCWTLKYADESRFHLDVLPAIPDKSENLTRLRVPPEYAKHAILYTDKRTFDNVEWPRSNPRGFAQWFRDQARTQFDLRRQMMAKSQNSTVEDVPDYSVRTPLQGLVQLLKRHRDLRYAGDPDKPASIIISTLTARAYEDEPDIVSAVSDVVPRLRNSIVKRDGVLWVENPVSPLENFADRWRGNELRREKFFAWLADVEGDLARMVSASDVDEASAVLKGAAPTVSKDAGLRGLFDVAHRKTPPWGMSSVADVTLTCFRKRDSGGWDSLGQSNVSLPRSVDLLFEASTSVEPPFDVYWQIVNTGEEAKRAGKLRGGLERSSSAGRGGLRHTDWTEYRGTHLIVCYIVRGASCIAKSKGMVVRVV